MERLLVCYSLQLDVVTPESVSHKGLLLVCEQLRATQAGDWGQDARCVLLIQGCLNTALQEAASAEVGASRGGRRESRSLQR